jgi:NADPH-dependent glutamate synthase beta subunit-like oxidoreductase
VVAEGGRLKGIEVIDNDLGAVDASGRRRPVPREGSNHVIELDTLIVAIGERPGTASLEGVDVQRWGGIAADPQTLATGREGVFAGGDVVTGPNTVIDAIAAGQRAAQMIDQYLRGEKLVPRVRAHLPEVVVAKDSEDESDGHERVVPPTLSMDARSSGFDEVELTMTEEAVRQEARRCLRCDLEFTQPAQNNLQQAEGGRA